MRAKLLKFKLDENIPISLKLDILSNYPNASVETVYDEKISGIKDLALTEICKSEERILITLDTDFLNLNLFPKENIYGVILLRITTQGKKAVKNAFSNFMKSFNLKNIEHNVIIVEEKSIRIRDLN